MTLLDAPTPLAAPGTYPVPTTRGRWRLTLHARGFGTGTWNQTILNELMSARSRSLTQTFDAPAELRFTMNGRQADTAAIRELQHEVMAWRWDDQTGADVCVFRGPIDHSEDQLSEQSHIVNFVAHDYLATLNRRFVIDAAPVVLTGYDQDRIVAVLVARAGGYGNTIGYTPGTNIAVGATLVDGTGTLSRGVSGVARDRTYLGAKAIGEAIAQLGQVTGGFDFDVIPEAQASDSLAMIDVYGTVGVLGAGRDALRIYYPSQGITRTDMVLQFGGNVSALTRTVNSGDYANYVRTLGNNASADPNIPQMVSAYINADASGGVIGFWPLSDQAPTDVNQQTTLDQRAQGLLAANGVLVPTYTLTLRADSYTWGSPRIGDTVPLVIESGRLSVNSTVRVMGLTYTIGDDGQEDVAVIVGRPLTSLGDLLARTNANVDALGRR